MKFKGIITALITPFYQGEVDKQSFIRLIKNQLSEEVDGLVLNGTTGESPTLTEKEVQQLVEWAQIEISGQVPLILGVGHNSTQKALENIKKARSWNLDGVLAVTPYYNKPCQEGLLKHFTKLALFAELPILLYNVPSRTQVSIEVPTIVRLTKEKMIAGIKEASGDSFFYSNLLSSGLPPDFTVTSGDDGTFLDLIAQGGHGVISVASHFMLQPMKDFLNQVLQKKEDALLEFQNKYGQIIQQLFKSTNPTMVKQIMFYKKIIRSPELRLPLCEPKKKLVDQMQKLLQQING